ncbi:nitroreductase/quinone reductase family protein [Pseudonocardia aurantiaca]|uniref:Nitroreductase/quinone reductase family protein n=1 Tax=Pseudonocardia aurantiaca TaxID=75290 RepID=A0ABW4FIS5_9PSEU
MAGNADVIEEFRANGGQVGGWLTGAPLVLLTTAGRRTGRPHTTPAVYLRDGDRYLVFASNAGGPEHPSWYRNILASPQVTMEVAGADGTVRILATLAVPLEGAERDKYWEQQCAIDPAFRAYEEQTGRVIPVVALIPLELSATERRRAVGEQLLRHHADLRAQLERVRDGLGGTADLGEQLRTRCLTYCYGLQLHHTREDGAFTALEAQFPELAPVVERLRAEHRVVERGLAELEALLQPGRSRDAAEVRAEVERVVTGLEEHFAYEEEHLLPALRG